MYLELSRQILDKILYVKWEQSCSMRTDGQTDIRKLIFAFRSNPLKLNDIYEYIQGVPGGM